MRKVHELLMELPVNTDKVHLVALQEFFFKLEVIESQ